MDYLMCFLCPPIALLMVNRGGQALANFFLIWFFWFPAVIHALIVVSDEHAQQRQRETVGMLLYAQSPALYAQVFSPPAKPVLAPMSPPNPQLMAHSSRNVRVEEWLGWFFQAHPAWTAVLCVTMLGSTAVAVLNLFTLLHR
jgi:uncharacterized membrane protein YqaE (UPF0057 family)